MQNFTGFGNVYFKKSEDGESNKAFLQGYKSVLNTKQSEESQANFARWEPRHGKFRFRHPWKHYLTVGSLTGQCAYRIDALNGYLHSEIQVNIYFSHQYHCLLITYIYSTVIQC